MTPGKREQVNRQMVGFAVVLLIGTAGYGKTAYDLASWRALGFAACVIGAVFCGLAVFLLWIATSVGAVDPHADPGKLTTRV